DPEAESAARLETTTPSLLARISVPAAMPAILAGAVFVFMLALTEFSIPDSLRTQPVLSQEIYMQFGTYYDAASAALASIMMMGLVLAVLAAFYFIILRCPPGS